MGKLDFMSPRVWEKEGFFYSHPLSKSKGEGRQEAVLSALTWRKMQTGGQQVTPQKEAITLPSTLWSSSQQHTRAGRAFIWTEFQNPTAWEFSIIETGLVL